MKKRKILFLLLTLLAINCSPTRELFYAYRFEKISAEPGYIHYGTVQHEFINLKSLDSLLRPANKIDIYLDDHIVISGRDASATQDSIVINTYGKRFGLDYTKVRYLVIDDDTKIDVVIALEE